MTNLLYWSIGLIVVVIGGWLCFDNIRQAIAAKKAKETFLKNHRDASLKVLPSVRMYSFLVLTLLCLACMAAYLFYWFQSEPDQRIVQMVIYLGLAAFCAALAVESHTLSRVAVCKEGFMVLNEYIRFKNIRDIEGPKGFFKSPSLVLNNGQSLRLPRGDIQLIIPLWKQYKSDHAAKRSRKKRNA